MPTVADVMSPHVTSITPSTSVLSARRLLHTHRFHHLPVVDDGRLVGIISDRDVMRGDDAAASAHEPSRASPRDQPVRSVMSTPVRSARPDDDLLYAVRQMLDWRISALPVVDHGHLVGVLTTTDCLTALHHLIADNPPMSPHRRT